MTLKALYRERIEAGLDMPSDTFNLFVKDQTKISRKKWIMNKEKWNMNQVTKKENFKRSFN